MCSNRSTQEASMVSPRAIILSLTAVAVTFSANAFGQGVAKNAFAPPSVPPRSDPPKNDTESANRLTPDQRGDVFMARKMFREAIDAYRQGPQSSPLTWNKIGIAYHQLGDLSAARRNYEKAIKVDKHYADAVNNVGTVYYAQKKYKTAIARYRKAIELKPDSAPFWSCLLYTSPSPR